MFRIIVPLGVFVVAMSLVLAYAASFTITFEGASSEHVFEASKIRTTVMGGPPPEVASFAVLPGEEDEPEVCDDTPDPREEFVLEVLGGVLTPEPKPECEEPTETAPPASSGRDTGAIAEDAEPTEVTATAEPSETATRDDDTTGDQETADDSTATAEASETATETATPSETPDAGDGGDAGTDGETAEPSASETAAGEDGDGEGEDGS